MLTWCLYAGKKTSSCVLIKVHVNIQTLWKLRINYSISTLNICYSIQLVVCHINLKSPSFSWIWGEAILSVRIRVQAARLYIMAVESYWNVVQITICVFSALASVVCGHFGRHARGETGRRSVLGREWDDWEPQTSEIPHFRWSALYPLVYFSLPFLASHV